MSSKGEGNSQALPPIKVLAVLASINPRHGGPPASAKTIWLAARRAGIEVTSAIGVEDPVRSDELGALREIKVQGISVHHFPFSARFPSGMWGVSMPLALWLFRYARQYDVVQLHGSWLFSTVAGLIAAKLSGRPLVLIPHESLTDFDVVTNGWAVKKIVKRLMRVVLLRSIDAVVFSSSLEQRDSVEQSKLPKSVVIYHPVYDDRQAQRAPRLPAGRDRDLRIGFLGRLHPKKNLEILLEAIAGTQGVSLKIAGDGAADYRKALVDLVVQYGLTSRVEWVGFVSGEQTTLFFNSIDVLAMPSAYECFGRVAGEAMAHAVPAIVSETTGMAEIVRRHRCGLVVTPDVASIRSAIEMLKTDAAVLADFSKRALQASACELSLKSYGEAISDLYRGMVQSRRSS